MKKVSFQLEDALLERLAGGDFLRHYTALLFREVARHLNYRITAVPEGMALHLDSEELYRILEQFPGSKRRESFKVWTDQAGTPPNVSCQDLLAFAKMLAASGSAPALYQMTAKALELLEKPCTSNGYCRFPSRLTIRIDR